MPASQGPLQFPSTSLTLILRAGPEASREHLERLCTLYWRPVYLYLRRVKSMADADARDHAQAFFEHVLEHRTLAKFDPGEGTFRAWLKKCLENFVSTQTRDQRRIKRGGGRSIVPLDAVEDVPAPADSTDDEFDRQWILDVLNRALAILEENLEIRNRSVHFKLLRAYALDRAAEKPPTYRELATRFGLKETNVRNHLHAVRKELEGVIRKLVREYAIDGAGAEKEFERVWGTAR